VKKIFIIVVMTALAVLLSASEFQLGLIHTSLTVHGIILTRIFCVMG